MKNYRSVIVYSSPPILPFVASIANKLFGTKIVFVCYDVYPEIAIETKTIGEGSIISKAMRVVNRSVYKRLSKVVVLSTDMKDYLLKNRPQLQDNQVVVIPNWYEDKTVENTGLSYQNELFKPTHAKDKFVISYLGNMGTAQDLTTLTEAIKILKEEQDIVFLFAGHGNKVPQLKKIINQENLNNVYVYDFLHGEDFQDALSSSDVFVVSLERGLSGLAVPSKTYSYLMAGKPVISIMSHNTELAQDLLKNNAGYNVEVGEVSNLVSVINSLKSDPEKVITMGKNARSLFLEKIHSW